MSKDEKFTAEAGSQLSLMDALSTAKLSDQLTTVPISEWRKFYDEISRRLESRGIADVSFFLNYGYADPSPDIASSLTVKGKLFNASSVRLVLEVIGELDLNQNTIVDIGCGRGGTAALIADRFTAKIIGIDISPEAIAFCRKMHLNTTLHFKVGDAMRIPLADKCCDVVMNIESSHSYANRGAFLEQVHRILRPQGWFLYADLLSASSWHDIKTQSRALSFCIRSEDDITTNVLAARDETANKWQEIFGGEDMAMANFLAVPGSVTYQRLTERVLEYKILRMQLCE